MLPNAFAAPHSPELMFGMTDRTAMNGIAHLLAQQLVPSRDMADIALPDDQAAAFWRAHGQGEDDHPDG